MEGQSREEYIGSLRR